MMNSTSTNQWMGQLVKSITTALICLTILVCAIAAVIIINRTEPTAEKLNSVRKSAALVETVTVQRGTYAPELVVLGNVQAAQEIMLSPRISGQVTELSPTFVPGGMVAQGDWLLQIDPADFENSLSVSYSELQQAQASLRIEQGRQSLAKKELALLEGTIDETNRALVLREPQIESIQAQVDAAKAAVQRAQLDLQRTRLVAPFDAQILSRSVNVGSQVSPGSSLARLVGIGEYWVTASVPVRSLQWIQFPKSDGVGSQVTLLDADSWPAGTHRTAQVARMIGALDQQTRLARVLVVVNDPLGLRTGAPPLIIDTLVECRIQGRPISNVIKIRREYVHENDTVWVMAQEKLQIRTTEVVFRDAGHAYIRNGLNDGDQVVTTNLATVAEGIGLKKMGPSTSPPESSAQEIRQ